MRYEKSISDDPAFLISKVQLCLTSSGGEPGTFYHARDVKGRHDLITWGWTKLDAHTCSSTSVLKTTTVFFSGRYGFSVLPSSLQSVIYSYPRRTSRFLESVATTRTTVAYKSRSFLPFNLSGAMSDTLRISNYTGLPCNLWLYDCCRQQFLSSLATCVLALITSSEQRGRDFESAHTQSCYLVSTLDVMHVIKCTRLSPSLIGRAWE